MKTITCKIWFSFEYVTSYDLPDGIHSMVVPYEENEVRRTLSIRSKWSNTIKYWYVWRYHTAFWYIKLIVILLHDRLFLQIIMELYSDNQELGLRKSPRYPDNYFVSRRAEYCCTICSFKFCNIQWYVMNNYLLCYNDIKYKTALHMAFYALECFLVWIFKIVWLQISSN